MKKSEKDENKGEISKMLEVKLVDERNDARFQAHPRGGLQTCH